MIGVPASTRLMLMLMLWWTDEELGRLVPLSYAHTRYDQDGAHQVKIENVVKDKGR